MAASREQSETQAEWEDTGGEAGGSSHMWESRSAQSLPAAGSTPDRADRSTQSLAPLARTIELEIIPRLVLARRAAQGAAAIEAIEAGVIGSDHVLEFAGLVLAHDVPVAIAYVEAARERGVSLEAVYLDLLAPSARHLGSLWEEDLCDFTEVTLGLWRLHQVLRELSPAFQSEVERGDPGHRILLAPGPGEQHMFGLIMVADFFRRAGWNVLSGPVQTTDEIAGMVRDEWFAVIGLSIGCGTRLDALSSCIRSVRRASRNQEIGVMVGGPMFIEHPELVALVGADATAIDGRQAVLQAQTLVDMLAHRQ